MSLQGRPSAGSRPGAPGLRDCGRGVGGFVGCAPEFGRAEGLSLDGGLAAEGRRAALASFGRCAAA